MSGYDYQRFDEYVAASSGSAGRSCCLCVRFADLIDSSESGRALGASEGA